MRKIILASVVVLVAGGLVAALDGCRKTTPKSTDQVRSGSTGNGNTGNSGNAQPVARKAADNAKDESTSDNPVAEQAGAQNKRAEYNRWLKEQYKTKENSAEDKEDSK